MQKESGAMGRIGGAGDEEEMAAAWATCRGLEATGVGQLSLGGEWRKSRERREAEVRDSVWPPVLDVAGGFCSNSISVVTGGGGAVPFHGFPTSGTGHDDSNHFWGGGARTALISIPQTDKGIGRICSVLYFWACITFLALERQYGKCVTKSALIFKAFVSFQTNSHITERNLSQTISSDF